MKAAISYKSDLVAIGCVVLIKQLRIAAGEISK